jgi:hypothetical protein
MERLTVRLIAFDEVPEDDYMVLAFAEETDGSGDQLMIQRSLSAADEQDRQLGMDTYCLVTASQATHYGGVTSWELRGKELIIQLQADAARVLGVEGGFILQLAVDQAASAGLLKTLLKIFDVTRDRPRIIGVS